MMKKIQNIAEQFPPSTFYTNRGYKHPLQTKDLLIRWWFLSFTQPGFHRFWRVWNPLLNYALFLFYIILGGNKRPFLAGFVVFTSCGFLLHDLLTLKEVIELDMTISFMIWAILCDLSRRYKLHKIQAKWPWIANVLVNVFLLVFGKQAGLFLWELLSKNI
ncbi:MAG: hypothetical protein VX278_21675 [Myxococcota bacterium]|nr:hypothetical protein [Myxococcota bacterium]